MSDSEKCFARPKVRFSKSAELPEKLTNRLFDKPRVKSLTEFKPKVKILKGPAVGRECDPSSSLEDIPLGSFGDAPNDLRLCPVKSEARETPCLTEIVLTPESRISSGEKRVKTSDVISRKSKAQLDRKPLSAPSNRLSLLGVPRKSFSSLPDKVARSSSGDEPGKSALRAKTSGAEKENVPAKESRVSLKVPNNTPRISSSASKSTIFVGEKSSEVGATKKLGNSATKSSLKARDVGKTLKPSLKPGQKATEPLSKPTRERKPIGLMPCMKSRKPQSAPSVKKTVLRVPQAPAGSSKAYVGPGTLQSKSTDIISKNEKPLRSREEIHSGDKLSRPEYNSIVCTIKQLQEARGEKIVTDLQHLPAIYRRLVEGKVSSALDFGANEAIYRDLVDLSIDEKQLPARLTRSRDPEPRQRDAAPKLCDFFVPTNDEEYRRAVVVRSPSPRLLDIWNPYKISDRIFSWKESLDSEL